jgi:hypothetical protein
MKGLPTRICKDDDGTYRLEILLEGQAEPVSVYWDMTAAQVEHYTGFRKDMTN